MSKLPLLAIIACCVSNISVAFEKNQLPISDALEKTFPEIKSHCYIIVNIDTGLVLTERNSDKKIEGGTFCDIYGGKRTTTLYSMSKQIKYSEIRFFKSDMSGIGCAYRFKNENGANFVCVIYGEESEEDATDDVKKINTWLNQFYLYKLNKNQCGMTIPILYGTPPYICPAALEKDTILLSKTLPKCVNRVYRYRTLMKAPVKKGDKVGYVLYYTSIFKNPITTIMYAKQYVTKKSWYKCIYDSIKYIIFGSS